MNTNWITEPSRRPAFSFTDTLTKDWMLVSAGEPGDLGTMTISWGASGFLWNKDVVIIAIRESRNTLKYLQSHQNFSLTVFDPSWHDKLFWCGRNSGRDVDKLAHCGLTPSFDEDAQTPYFEEAHTTIICKQLFHTRIEPEGFMDTLPSEIWETWYNTGAHTGDHHQLIIASIEKIMTKQ